MQDLKQSNDYKDTVRQVILQAGALANDYFRKSSGLSFNKKSPKDLVTEADIHVEKFIRSQLTEKYPKLGFWGEETGASEELDNCWVVDPIDGTHSFFRGQYFWSISIALKLEGELRIGAVYAPALNDLYLGEKGMGAYRNGHSIKCSPTNALNEAMVCTGFACLRSNLQNNNLERFNRVALETRDQRRCGSAALEMCMVGSGQLDAFWEQHLNHYDVAAGAVIAKEAGAVISDFKGKEGLNPEEVLVTNVPLHQAMVDLM
jgi:myo-inositol-1(or 4)-monophosphatase